MGRRLLTTHTHDTMNDAQRAEALAELASRLVELTTPAERRTYPALEHITDLIADLEG